MHDPAEDNVLYHLYCIIQCTTSMPSKHIIIFLVTFSHAVETLIGSKTLQFGGLFWLLHLNASYIKTVHNLLLTAHSPVYPKTLLRLENRKLYSYGGLVLYVMQVLVKFMCLRVITADSMATFTLRDLWLPQITTYMFGLYSNLLHTQSTGLPRGLPRSARMKLFDISLAWIFNTKVGLCSISNLYTVTIVTI